MGQGVTGEGFVNVANDYSTTLQPYVIRNCVTVSWDCSDKPCGGNPGSTTRESASDCEGVTVLGDPGTELRTREHGSGDYDSDEKIKMLTKNKSISMDKDMSATYRLTTLGLPCNRSVTYDSKWTEEACAKNRVTGASMHESYRYATNIDRNSRMKLDKNESEMETDTEFNGMGHIGFLKKSHPDDTAQDTPTFESREDYTGSFRVYENVDEYGSSVVSNKSASGTGFVAADKRIKESQRTYEHGTGSYQSDEQIRTHTNYIAKDINVIYEPSNQSLISGMNANQSLKWKEGMWSKVENTSFIGEEITSADRIEKEAVYKGLNEMESEANFSGTARYRTVVRNEIDLDEMYTGNYSIAKKVMVKGIPKYDRPHMTVIKTGEIGNQGSTVLNYTITILNDGNKNLGPLYVKDIFPPGTEFLGASVKPAELTSSYANWTQVHLAIGESSTIDLRLNMTEYHDTLINRVEATAGSDDKQITSRNFSAIEIDWLSCCPSEIFVSKTGTVDPDVPNIVWYRLTIENLADSTMAAHITDELPSGMEFLGSSITPSSYEPEEVTWELTDLAPGESQTIEYVTEAQRSGRFVNRARVDAYTDDGPTIQPVYVNSVIEIGEFEGEMPAPGWQPPDWDFKYTGYLTELTCEEICSLTPSGRQQQLKFY
ncbi:MAG: hypothetical protein ACXQT4_02630 [Methanotrichaceae archaeon]